MPSSVVGTVETVKSTTPEAKYNYPIFKLSHRISKIVIKSLHLYDFLERAKVSGTRTSHDLRVEGKYLQMGTRKLFCWAIQCFVS